MTALNADRVQACSELLQQLAQNLDRISDLSHLAPPHGDPAHLTETLTALHGVLAGANAVLNLEVKQWKL